MDLVIDDVHIIHYHMDPLWSVAMSQNDFTHPNYLVIYCEIPATLLHSTIINPVEAPNAGRYVWIFEGMAVYMLNSAHCYHIIIVFHNLFPHVTTVFPLH